MKRPDPVTALAAGAAAVTVLLTAAAFWLSYEHLHDIAGANGLDGARAWAWPGTVDLFIVAGELLILRAALRGRFDWFAYLLAGVGSLGSIALNVAGVGADAQPMEYVVAAVPPSAALIAFGALMRQVHDALARLTVTDQTTAAATTGPTALPRVIPVPFEVPIVPALAPVPLPPAVVPVTTPATNGRAPAYAAAPAREVVTTPVTPTTTEATTDMSPGQRRQAARRLNRQHIRDHGRPVTVDVLRAELDLSRREAAELRRHIVEGASS